MKISTLVSCLLATPLALGAVIKRNECHQNNLYRALKRLQRDSAFCSQFLNDNNTPYPPNERNVPATTPKADVLAACNCIIGDYLGLEVAIYENPYVWSWGYPTFVHSYVATKTPWGQSTARSLGEYQVNTPAEDEPHRYGLPAPNGLVYTLNFRGYFLCPADGPFTIQVNNPDDVAFVWTGPTAQCGWQNVGTDSPTSMRVDWPQSTESLSIACTKGSYIPIRIIWADESGPRGWGFNIFDSSNNYYVSNTVPSTYLFKQSPEGTPGPFPGAFGAEPVSC